MHCRKTSSLLETLTIARSTATRSRQMEVHGLDKHSMMTKVTKSHVALVQALNVKMLVGTKNATLPAIWPAADVKLRICTCPASRIC